MEKFGRHWLGMWLVAVALAFSALGAIPVRAQTLLNVSYDPTRELYKELNAAFIADWRKQESELRSRGRTAKSDQTEPEEKP